MTDVKKSRDVNDILDNLKLTRTSSLGEVMGRANRGEGASGALASIYSKLRSSKESFAQRERERGICLQRDQLWVHPHAVQERH